MRPQDIQRLALVNFGGIGDEILFSPVIRELKRCLPHTHITLFLERRSAAVRDLLPEVDAFVEMTLQSRPQTFLQLSTLLRRKAFDAVISSGSSPFIPLALFSSGVPTRVGFQTGDASRRFLTQEAPLVKQQYAARMYFALARRFLLEVFGTEYQTPEVIQPVLRSSPDLPWAQEVLAASAGRKRVLLHPGVSQVSIDKKIYKGWSPERWAALIQDLTTDHAVFLVGGPDDASVVEKILSHLPAEAPHFHNLFGQTRNLRQLAALIEAADLLVSVDSSPLHLAVGYNKPVVAMFGPTDETKLLPVAPHFRAVRREFLHCRPCLWDRRAVNCETSVCLHVPVGDMVAAARDLL